MTPRGLFQSVLLLRGLLAKCSPAVVSPHCCSRTRPGCVVCREQDREEQVYLLPRQCPEPQGLRGKLSTQGREDGQLPFTLSLPGAGGGPSSFRGSSPLAQPELFPRTLAGLSCLQIPAEPRDRGLAHCHFGQSQGQLPGLGPSELPAWSRCCRAGGLAELVWYRQTC